MKSSLLFILVLFVLPVHAEFYDYLIDLDSEYKPQTISVLGQDPLTLDSFQRDRSQYKSYSEFLNYLKQRAPELYRQPILLHHTGSIQKASFTEPRVLLFGGGSVLSFDYQKETQVHRVEMIQYNPEQANYQMGELRFFSNGQVEFEANPTRCVACHGRQPKPIWAPYDLWAKSYGVLAGTMVSGPEKAHFKEFQQKQDWPEIYGFIRRGVTDFNHKRSLESYTQYLSTINQLRIMTSLKSKAQLKPFRYALMAALNGCTSYAPMGGGRPEQEIVEMEDYLPESLKNSFPLPHSFFVQDSKASREKFIQYTYESYQRMFGSIDIDLEVTRRLDSNNGLVASIRYLTENLGIDWRQYILGHGENDYSITTPSNLPFDLGTVGVYFDPSLYFELRPQRVSTAGIPIEWIKFDCQVLKEKSLVKLKKINTVETKALGRQSHQFVGRSLAPVSRCNKCHVVEKRAPYIPFDDTMALRRWLKQSGHLDMIKRRVESGSMPMGSQLTLEEKQSLIEVFDLLSK